MSPKTRLGAAFLVSLVLGSVSLTGSAAPSSHSRTTSSPAGPRARSEAVLEPGQADVWRDELATSPTAPPARWSHPQTEWRGIWLPGKDMLATTATVLEKLDALARAHFNAVMPDAYFKGYVIYPDSKYLPQLPEAKGRDPLGFFIQEAHKRGLEVHAWLEYGFYAYHTPDATKDSSMGPWLDAHPELVSVNARGDKFIHNPAWGDFYSMCPANPKSHELIASIAAEIAERYPVDGINLDRIRFAGSSFCYCAYCKEHFRKDTGLELVAFAKGSKEERRFLEWKRQKLVEAVRTIRDRVKAVRSSIVLTSYVVPPTEKDDKAQPWDLWAKLRLLDAVAVSMYGRDIVGHAQKAREILGAHGDVLVAAISCDVPSAVYLANIEKARQYAPLGQITWYSGEVMDDIEGLATGPYSAPARSPFARSEATTAPLSAR